MFHDDLLGMPPKHDVQFIIDLVPRIIPVSKVPYWMAPSELQEIKEKLQGLMEKGFIQPSMFL